MQKLLMIIVLTTLTIVIITGAAQLAFAQPMPVVAPCSITGAATDLLMSDDMAKYLAHEGRGLVHDEGDME